MESVGAGKEVDLLFVDKDMTVRSLDGGES